MLHDFFPQDFFWSLFFPHEITLALFFPSGNSKQLRWIEFPSGKNKASVISFGKKRLLKKSFVKKSCKLCCCLFPSILYFIRTILGGAVFLPIKGALILQKAENKPEDTYLTWWPQNEREENSTRCETPSWIFHANFLVTKWGMSFSSFLKVWGKLARGVNLFTPVK